LYSDLAATGVHVAFADTDQLCICYPAPPGDPSRQHVKTLNVRSMIPNFRAAGARCLIVNGVLDQAGLETGLLPDADVTICQLRADYDVIERRFAGHHRHRADLDKRQHEVQDDIRLMDDSGFADACVDTSHVPAGEVADLVRAACKGWPGFTGELADAAGQLPVRRGPGGGRVVLITGPTGVGKSTIGFRFYMKCLNAGLTAGYVDLSQIGFVRPAHEHDPDNQRLKARNLAAIWRNYLAAGATHLVVTGTIAGQADLRRYADELDGTHVTLTRLRAGGHELRLRIMSRAAGGSWPETGDRLRGQSAEFLADVADHAIRAAEGFDRPDAGGVAVDTSGLSPQEAADAIADAIHWPDHVS
jgi:hypothetical protein